MEFVAELKFFLAKAVASMDMKKIQAFLFLDVD